MRLLILNSGRLIAGNMYKSPNIWFRTLQIHLPVLSKDLPSVTQFRGVSTDVEPPQVLQPVSKASSTSYRIKKISKAMLVYLERSKIHQEFIQIKSEEFEIGKHHLANMMGVEVGALSQEDIDKAIRYLLPSGLFEPKARPMMKPPEQMYPKQKAAQFDVTGRPFSPFFYTNRANMYQAMHTILGKFEELDALEDKMIRKGITEVPLEMKLVLSGSEWLNIDDVRNILLETIFEDEYTYLMDALNRLAEHPYSFRVKDVIWKFRRDFPDVSQIELVPELIYDTNGRSFMEIKARKHTANVEVKVWGNGTGKVDINGKDITFFPFIHNREQILFPLEYSGMLNKVDIEAKLVGGGNSNGATALRYAIAMCLRSFVSNDVREKMRLAGLCTVDIRKRERKKPGQKGARAKFKWLKR